MSVPVDKIPGLPKVSDGTEDWTDFIGSIAKCNKRVPKDVGAGYYEMFGKCMGMAITICFSTGNSFKFIGSC